MFRTDRIKPRSTPRKLKEIMFTQRGSATMRIVARLVSLYVAALTLSLAASAVFNVLLPASAHAYATIVPPPVFSTAPGLPDGRVYEQVSPADKSGNEAGAEGNQYLGGSHYALAAPDGNSVLFEATGAIGETASALSLFYVAQRSPEGWSARAVTPRLQQAASELGGLLVSRLGYLDPSSDLSHAMFAAKEGRYATPPNATCGSELDGRRQLYLSGSDPFVAATWLPQPEIKDPIENCSEEGESGAPVGGTPDFSTVYFTYPGTLLPEDASRVPHALGTHTFNEEKEQKEAEEAGDDVVIGGQRVEAWGFYEDKDGVLREAGVLPDGSLDPFGAVPADSGHGRGLAGNQVSADGSRAFFVSPDPVSCEQNGGQNNCMVDPPELYVRENGEKTVLVSQDTLLPLLGGLPAGAPSGVVQMGNQTRQLNQNLADAGSYVFASPDGSQAFFQSEDRLTSDAPEGPPGNASPKTYDFDVDTGSVAYLPNVVGQIVASSQDGSSFVFVRPESGGSPAELDLWSTAPGGGNVTPITQLPGPLKHIINETQEFGAEIPRVPSARMSSDGSVVVFTTSDQIAGFNNGGTHANQENGGVSEAGSQQIYRYDVPANTLGCVSCPPAGVTPTGNAVMSPLRAGEEASELYPVEYQGMVDEHGISSDGGRVFFDTPDPLVPQDTNTRPPEKNTKEAKEFDRDVYEWENGVVYLISSGKGTQSSFFLDNSENGNDLFFATTEGLVAGDTDGAYDAYDARIPHPDDSSVATAVPCQGSVCQGPPRVPVPLTSPASATFSGLGNIPPESVLTPPTPKKITKKTVKCKKGKRLVHGKCVKIVSHQRNGKKSRAKKGSVRS
jgi:hypothetical protein